MKRRGQGDLGFRLTTGVFAVLVVAIVIGIGAVLISESWLSIQKLWSSVMTVATCAASSIASNCPTTCAG